MTTSEAEKSVSDKSLTTIVYALYAASLVFGVTCLVAIIINYVKRDDVAGTWLESHFRWHLRTFWYSLAWSVLLVGVLVLAIFSIFFGAAAPIAVGAGPLEITNALIAAIIAAPVAFVLLAVAFLALSVWISYRIVRGWLALGERRPMPA